MANIKSKIKRIGTNQKSEDRNKAVKTEVKSAIRAVRDASTAGEKGADAAALVGENRKIDKAVSKGVIHKNQAAKRKSAIAKKVNSL